MQEGVYDKFEERFSQTVNERMIPGHTMDTSTTLGLLINDKSPKKVERLVKDAVETGAQLSSRVHRLKVMVQLPS